jgi:hypothetical protein
MTATNKRLLISESRVDSNRCTHCKGKPDQHAMYASHSSPRTSSVRFQRRVGERGFDAMVTQLHQLSEPISSACDQYVQYLFTRANRMVLNRHRRVLQPWRCWLTTYPLPDLPNQLSPLSPNGPARSPI